MAYDIFISYRRDGGKEKARALNAELERRGYSVFLDFDELKDGVFDRRIMEAIDSAPIFMVLVTPHSLDRCLNEDDWVRREIEYAMDKKRHFVPIDPDGSFCGFPEGLSERLCEGLGQHQFSEVMFGQLFHASLDKMIQERIEPVLREFGRASAAREERGAIVHLETDLDCRVLRFGKEIATVKAGKETVVRIIQGKHRLEFISLENDADRKTEIYPVASNDMEDILFIELAAVRDKRLAAEEAERTYKVGDYYDVGGKRGVVFQVWDGGRHGKIVSLDEAKLQWAVDEYFNGVNPVEIEIQAKDRANGAANQRVVENIRGWREQYPAFAWCADHGEGWYLPAIEEVKLLLLNKEVHDAVNRALEQRGTKLRNIGECAWYWPSTQYEGLKLIAWFVNMGNGLTDNLSKYGSRYVRAVSAF